MSGNPAAVRVRGREQSDLESIAAIFACPGVIAGTLRLPFQSLDALRARYASQPPDTYSLVAELDGRVVGELGLHVPSNPRRRHTAELGMAVHQDAQGRGVGTALMAAAIDLADNWLGLRRLELQVYSDNAAAVHLYQKFGFEIEGTMRDYALRDGQFVDAYTMARVRAPSGID